MNLFISLCFLVSVSVFLTQAKIASLWSRRQILKSGPPRVRFWRQITQSEGNKGPIVNSGEDGESLQPTVVQKH